MSQTNDKSETETPVEIFYFFAVYMLY